MHNHVPHGTRKFIANYLDIKLTILPSRINSDLLISDTLKNTGAVILFGIFGETDIAIPSHADGKLVVEDKGVEVHDPTTGKIRCPSINDIAD